MCASLLPPTKSCGIPPRKGKFREDLFHRFNEFSIDVPPLRNRPDDIMLFANHFLQVTNAELGKRLKRFSPEVEAYSGVMYGTATCGN
jgi:DNA-binding NtrC family response regulator